MFLRRFRIFRAALKSYLTSLTPSTTTPGPGTPPANRTKEYIYIYYLLYIIYYTLYIIYYIIDIIRIYIYVRASDYGCDMTWSLPLSYWSPEKSYTTSSRTATSVYIAARFRVKIAFNQLSLGNKNHRCSWKTLIYFIDTKYRQYPVRLYLS